MAANAHTNLWVHLRGWREAVVGVKAVGRQVGILGTQTERLAKHLDRANRRGFLMNQTLFTLRRYSYMATLGFTAMIGSVVKWGFDFNRVMEMNRSAMIGFLGSTKAVDDELNLLYRLAAFTPLRFQDVANAARTMMAFGINTKTTNRLVTDMIDMLAAMGKSTPASLNRVTIALGHMMNIGHVTGQTLLQLARDNIPVYEILQEQLGLTGDELRNIGRLGISAQTTLEAIMAGIEADPKFHGAARRLSLQTIGGIASTIQDYVAQIMGRTLHHPFLGLERAMRGIFDILDESQTRHLSFTETIGLIDPRLELVLRLVERDIKSLSRIFQNALWPAIMNVATVALPILYAGFWAMSQVLDFFSHHALIARVIMTYLAAVTALLAIATLYLIPVMILRFTIGMSVALMERLLITLGIKRIETTVGQTAADTTHSLVLTRLGRALRIAVFWTLRSIWAGVRYVAVKTWEAAVTLYLAIVNSRLATWLKLNAILTLFGIRVGLRSAGVKLFEALAATIVTVAIIAQTVAQEALNVMTYLFPGTWLAAALMAVLVGMIILEAKFHAFTRAVRWSWHQVHRLIEKLHGLRDAIKNSGFGRFLSLEAKVLGTVFKRRPLINRGDVSSATSALSGGMTGGGMGDMPSMRGSQFDMKKLPALPHTPGIKGGLPVNIPAGYEGAPIEHTTRIVLELDRKVLAEAVSKERLDRQARR